MSHFPANIKLLLSLAARSSSPQMVELLIKSGTNINVLDESGNAPIHWAVIGEHLDVLNCLIENGADINFRNKDLRLALHLAIYNQNSEIINLLLNKGSEIDIYASVMLGKIDIINKFINEGFDVNKPYTNLGEYPIADAIHFQQIDTIKFLLQVGANINTVLTRSGDYVLHLYGAVKNIEIFNLLVSSRADIHSKNNRGYTPLHVAARSSCFDTVKKLVEMGADINAIGENGNTPLWEAAYSQNQQTIEYLLLSGANVNVIGELGKTPLIAAQHRRGGLAAAQTLVAHGADVNAVDQRGISAIHIATAQGNYELVRLLIDHGANIL